MPNFFSNEAKDLLTKLLAKDPSKRLGANGISEIKNHEFFANMSWEDIILMKKTPPIVPLVINALDSGNFDPAYRFQKADDTPVKDPEILKNKDDAFLDFSYQAPDIEKVSIAHKEKLLTSKLI